MNDRKKILILCPYPKDCAPSQRLKFEHYYDFFNEKGYDVTVSSFVSKKFWKILYQKGYWSKKIIYTLQGYAQRFYDLFRLHRYHIIYIHLWVTPLGLPLFEHFVKLLSKKIIYDIDDMVFLGHSSEANRTFKALKGTKKMIYLMKNANHVITCTPTLDEFVKQFNSNTTDISSTINTKTYKPKKEYNLHNPIIIGWSGSHSTSSYLKILEPVFLELIQKGYFIQIHVIGDRNFGFENKKIPVKSIDWNLDTEVADLSEFDIGVYPLPFEPWVYGKSGLKALQYMALGIPTVATAVGANYRIIESGKNGFLIENNDTSLWVEQLIYLIEHKECREFIGRNGRETVVQKFSVEANQNTYLSVLESVISAKKH